MTISSDPHPSIIIHMQDEESVVINSFSSREINEQLWMLDSDVLLGNSLWNESVEVKDHANGTLIIDCMEVEGDTIQEVEV